MTVIIVYYLYSNQELCYEFLVEEAFDEYDDIINKGKIKILKKYYDDFETNEDKEELLSAFDELFESLVIKL